MITKSSFIQATRGLHNDIATLTGKDGQVQKIIHITFRETWAFTIANTFDEALANPTYQTGKFRTREDLWKYWKNQLANK